MVRKSRHTTRSRASTVNRRTALVTVALSLAILGLGMRLLTGFLSSPVQGIISLARVASFQSRFDMAPTVCNGDYASFAYPKGLTSIAIGAPVHPVVASYRMVYRGTQVWNVAITVVQVPSGRLADNNAYQFRKLSPDRYEESSAVLNGQAVTLMNDKDANGFNEVGFLVHNQYQSVISITGDDQQGAGSLRSTLAMIVGTWHWSKG